MCHTNVTHMANISFDQVSKMRLRSEHPRRLMALAIVLILKWLKGAFALNWNVFVRTSVDADVQRIGVKCCFHFCFKMILKSWEQVGMQRVTNDSDQILTFSGTVVIQDFHGSQISLGFRLFHILKGTDVMALSHFSHFTKYILTRESFPILRQVDSWIVAYYK